MKRKYRIGLEILAPITLVASGVAAAATRFYDYAFRRVDYVPDAAADKQKYADEYFEYVNWFNSVPSEHWTLHKEDLENHVEATFIPAEHRSDKTVIIAHGYKGNGEAMANFAKMFYDNGFNVVCPDDRAHGTSSGDYINFGWLDRLDYVEWAKMVVDKIGNNSEIVLFGVSMGSATIQMTSGEKLPPQVKVLISDCGYSSLDEELTYLLKTQFHLPRTPLTQIISQINRRRLGFSIDEVSSVKQLQKNKLPIMFIHGEKDLYVPTSMLEKSYAATQGPKAKWIVKNAVHAESFWINPIEYKNRVMDFINQNLFK